MSSKASCFELPGFTMPLNHSPGYGMFPSLLDTDTVARVNVNRELLMMQAINAITDKANWEQKIFNDDILAKWRTEIMESGEDITAKMLSWIVQEAKWKAEVVRETGQVVAFNIGVVKSDTAVSEELRRALIEAVRPLEDVPGDQKDYHPGSDQQVVDLVHPSLFPVIYGRTRILPDKRIDLEDFESGIGEGQVLPVPREEETGGFRQYRPWDRTNQYQPYSRNFQWLPCDIQLAGDDDCHVTTYINNLHPRRHRPLYNVIEKILARAIPLWNTSLSFMKDDYQRIRYDEVEFEESLEPEPVQKNSDEEDQDEFWERYEEWENNRIVKRPEPGDFEPHVLAKHSEVDLRRDFADHGLQVIVKLANIELTPDKPAYKGGSWHIEGQLNEHICATAIYYYDSANITESTLEFRQRADTYAVEDISYPQGQHSFVQQIFNFNKDVTSWEEADITQTLGGVITRQGRLLTFPNVVQHRVGSFGLADPSKPGHRKILALFLVDPHMRIISSGNVPPQREDWWKERQQVVSRLLTTKLPVELQNMVYDDLEATPISMEEAKKYREQLMEERSIKTTEQNEVFEKGGFSLCEH